MIISGSISIKAAIEGKKRKIRCVYLDKNKESKDFNYIKHLCEKNNIEIIYQNREQLDQLALNKSHGGIIGECDQREYDDLNNILKKKKVFLAYIEGIEDPYSLGYSIRTLYALGCDGLFIKGRDWLDSEATILKSSAGAYDKLPILNFKEDTISILKKNDIKIICATRKEAISLEKGDFQNSFVVCIGGVLRGLSREISDNADENVFIPYQNDFHNSLDISSAVAIISYQAFMQRNKQ